MLCLSRPVACAGIASFAVACAGAPIEAETAIDVPYVHPWVSARLDLRVAAIDPKDDLDPLEVPHDLTDDEVAQLVDPERSREAKFANAFGGVRRPTLDCFSQNHGAADVWIVGRTGNSGAIRALELARSTADPEATRCVLRAMAGARGPAAHVGFSYLLHVEPWPVGCTTVDCERLPPLPRVNEQPPIGVSTAHVDVSNSTIDQFRSGLRACYGRALSQDPDLQGRFTLRARIDANGAVASVEATSVSGGLASVADCARARFASLVFPTPEMAPMEMVFPVTFSTPNMPPPAPPLPKHRILDAVESGQFMALARAKGIHSARARQSEGGGEWLVFLERGGRVATVRRTEQEVPQRKHRERFEISRSWSLVLDDPDAVFDGELFDELER